MKTSIFAERKIIEAIIGRLEKMPDMPVPFGDDVSAYLLKDGKLLVLKMDMLVDKTDVPKAMNIWQASRKAVVMNVSDFAAKGVEPRVILVSLGLPRKMARRDIVEKVGEGLNAGAREYGAYIVGGDTSEASDFIISISLFGTTKKNGLMLRSGAKPGDITAVTGSFGKTAAGLKILLGGCQISSRIEKALTESVLMPHARLAEGLALRKTGAVTASIDSSDGLAWSLHEIARASNVGFSIKYLPIADEVRDFAELNQLVASDLALYGGEEYELVVTIKPGLWDEARKAVEKVNGQLLPIGEVVTGRKLVLENGGRKCFIKPQGWEHFKN